MNTDLYSERFLEVFTSTHSDSFSDFDGEIESLYVESDITFEDLGFIVTGYDQEQFLESWEE